MRPLASMPAVRQPGAAFRFRWRGPARCLV